jgi:hypothetical protein
MPDTAGQDFCTPDNRRKGSAASDITITTGVPSRPSRRWRTSIAQVWQWTGHPTALLPSPASRLARSRRPGPHRHSSVDGRPCNAVGRIHHRLVLLVRTAPGQAPPRDLPPRHERTGAGRRLERPLVDLRPSHRRPADRAGIAPAPLTTGPAHPSADLMRPDRPVPGRTPPCHDATWPRCLTASSSRSCHTPSPRRPRRFGSTTGRPPPTPPHTVRTEHHQRLDYLARLGGRRSCPRCGSS